MDHQQIKNQLSAYFDGEVSAEMRTALERHIGECAECTGVLSDMRMLSGMLSAQVDAGDSRVMAERMKHAIAVQMRHRAERLVGWLSALAASIALAAGIRLADLSQTPPAPMAWVNQAARLTEDPDSNRKVIMAQWIVTGLSKKSQAGSGAASGGQGHD